MTSTDSYARWVEDHHAAVYRAALRIVRSAADAEDVAQQVFVRALADRARLERADDVSAVLRWLAVKTALLHLRTESRRREREARVAQNDIDLTPSPQEDRATREEHAALERAIARLPDDLRAAVVGRYRENLTLRAIAAGERCSEPTILDRVRRAVDRLRRELGATGFPALAVGLEQRLERGAPSAPELHDAPSPRLKDDLLRLPHAQLAAPVAAKLAAAVALVAAAVGGSWVTFRDSSPSVRARSAHEATATTNAATPSDAMPDARSTERVDVSATPEVTTADAEGGGAASRESLATIRGRLRLPPEVDRAQYLVAVSSVAREGKTSAHGALAKLDESGAFELAFPVQRADGEDVQLTVAYADASVRAPQDLRVRPGETTDVGWLDGLAPVRERAGRWRIDLLVKRPDGAPLSRATVRLSREIETYSGTKMDKWETGGLSDDDGVVHLEGEQLGPKSLDVTTMGDELVELGARLDVTEPGFARREVTLAVTRRFEKHASGFYTPIDERPILGEIHGRLVDMATLQPLATPYPDVQLSRVESRDQDEFVSDAVPNLLIPVPVQTLEMGERPEPTDRFTLTARESGSFAIVGRFDGKAAVVLGPFELPRPAEAAMDDVELRFSAATSIAGIVRDERGAPLAGAVLFVTGTGPMSDRAIAERDDVVRKAAGDGTFWFAHARSKDDGRFTIGNLPAGALIRVAALDPFHEPARSGAFRVGAESGDVPISLDRPRAR